MYYLIFVFLNLSRKLFEATTKCSSNRPLFPYYCLLNTVDSKENLPMAGFEPRTSGIGSHRSNASVSNRNALGAAIAQWIRLCLPSCRPRFESQAHTIYALISYSQICLCIVKRRKLTKRGQVWPIF